MDDIALVNRTSKVPADDSAWQELQEIFARSAAKSEEIEGLEMNEEKTVWGAESGLLLGAQLDRSSGMVSSPPETRRLLVLATLAAVRVGRLRVRQAAAAAFGSVDLCVLHARSALAVLQEAYQLVVGRSSEQEFVTLNAPVVGEFLALCSLAPALAANLRVPVAPLLLCSDASPSGGGLAAMRIPPQLAGELWRRRSVGGHTRLATPFEACRLEHSHDSGGAAANACFVPKGSLQVFSDFLEVCAGPSAPLTKAMGHCGLVTGPAIDVKRHPYWDLLRGDPFTWLIAIVRAVRVYYLHVAPPCTTLSVACRPPLLSRLCPYGAPEDSEAQEWNRMFLHCLTLLWLQGRAGRSGSARWSTRRAPAAPPFGRCSRRATCGCRGARCPCARLVSAGAMTPTCTLSTPIGFSR